MTKVIDKNEALALVKKFADAEPDKKVASCYAIDDVPECIVGCILGELGADMYELGGAYSRFSKGSRDVAGNGIPNALFADRNKDSNILHALPDVTFTDEAVDVLDAAQSIQDDRFDDVSWKFPEHNASRYDYDRTWGSAGRYVEKYFGASE